MNLKQYESGEKIMLYLEFHPNDFPFNEKTETDLRKYLLDLQVQVMNDTNNFNPPKTFYELFDNVEGFEFGDSLTNKPLRYFKMIACCKIPLKVQI